MATTERKRKRSLLTEIVAPFGRWVRAPQPEAAPVASVCATFGKGRRRCWQTLDSRQAFEAREVSASTAQALAVSPSPALTASQLFRTVGALLRAMTRDSIDSYKANPKFNLPARSSFASSVHLHGTLGLACGSIWPHFERSPGYRHMQLPQNLKRVCEGFTFTYYAETKKLALTVYGLKEERAAEAGDLGRLFFGKSTTSPPVQLAKMDFPASGATLQTFGSEEESSSSESPDSSFVKDGPTYVSLQFWLKISGAAVESDVKGAHYECAVPSQECHIGPTDEGALLPFLEAISEDNVIPGLLFTERKETSFEPSHAHGMPRTKTRTYLGPGTLVLGQSSDSESRRGR